MADISQIKVGSTTYNLKDTEARKKLENVTNVMDFIGVSTSTITDEGTQNPTINGTVVTTKQKGDVVLYDKQEFVWDGDKWNQLGDMSGLGSLAFKDSATGTVSLSGSTSTRLTPEGSVTSTFTGSNTDVSVTGTPAGSIVVSAPGTSDTATYTPEGIITAPGTSTAKAMTGVSDIKFTGTPSEISIIPNGSVGSTTAGGTVTLTGSPTGDTTEVVTGIKTATFTGTPATISVSGTPTGKISSSKTIPDNETANYTPEGTITMNGHNHTGTVTVTMDPPSTIDVLTGLGAVTTNAVAASVNGELLTLSTGTVTTNPTTTPVVNSIKTPTASVSIGSTTSTGKFAGTSVYFSFVGTALSMSQNYTPAGKVTITTNTADVLSSVGIGSLTASFAGNAHSHSFTGSASKTNYTPAGTIELTPSTDTFVKTVSAPSFTGVGKMFKFSGSPLTLNGTCTPKGSVSSSFSGTEDTYTGSFSGSTTVTVS